MRHSNRTPKEDRKHRNRRGATAVEFAMVAPIVFTFMFGLLEISTWFQVDGVSTTAVLRGGREALITTTSVSNVKAEVVETLGLIGVNDVRISVTPTTLDASTETIQVDIEVPMTAINGFYLSNFVSSDRSIRRSVTVERF